MEDWRNRRIGRWRTRGIKELKMVEQRNIILGIYEESWRNWITANGLIEEQNIRHMEDWRNRRMKKTRGMRKILLLL